MTNATTSLCPDRKRALLVTPRPDAREFFTRLWPDAQVEVIACERASQAWDILYSGDEPPDLFILDWLAPGGEKGEMARRLKSESLFKRLPIIVLLDPSEVQTFVSAGLLEVDDFLIWPCLSDEARARALFIFCRVNAAFDANPLTRLPGNTTILQRMQDAIDARQEFALGYVDLDHFKAFNDKYGFSRGDEVIGMTARIVANTVAARASRDAFVGHIGGDDFVFMTAMHEAEPICREIIRNFDAIVPSFYDAEDREQGFIRSKDRQGRTNDFPIMGVSIGVVMNHAGQLRHPGEASQSAVGLNKRAKQSPYSDYVLDQRRP